MSILADRGYMKRGRTIRRRIIYRKIKAELHRIKQERTGPELYNNE